MHRLLLNTFPAPIVRAIAAGQTALADLRSEPHIGGREFDDALVKSFILRGLCGEDSL